MSNFEFLKKNNENLFKIVFDAEKLFRDEYFEQVVVQTRRFAENICRDLLQDNILIEETFDSMINRIKDKSFGNIRMKEFSEDLYFLKKHGNNSAHSKVATKNGEIALECLERAYEIAIFYSNFKYGYNKKLDNSVFSEEMLMTGKATPKKALKEIYSVELKKARKSPLLAQGKKTQKIVQKKPSKPLRKRSKKLRSGDVFSFLFKAVIVLLLVYLACDYLYNWVRSLT